VKVHKNSILLFKKYATEYFSSKSKVLEIGADAIPSTYQQIVESNEITWDTIDLQKREGFTFVSNSEYSFPIKSNEYDIVLSGQVLEHVRKPWIWLKEIYRVVNVGGIVITINPASWPYHEAPIDCWRAYPDGMISLYEDAGLSTIISKCECLEVSPNKRRLPGRTMGIGLYPLASNILSKFGYPIECSFDTITIGKKL
jgi:SAM-dependent methyltransferase